ncbi:hypothetical protein CCACVL1_26722 [Corchorus capsularis]|uniref:Uncharacterized protein n=1 Tax=Corchorus capsularis TaxID=210143 RepID=A0A1R3GDL2_COCAP|nr:hypothetical protein CCACVL1_26722 [Corchorus capsularis]
MDRTDTIRYPCVSSVRYLTAKTIISCVFSI